jgi:hypothetical protein
MPLYLGLYKSVLYEDEISFVQRTCLTAIAEKSALAHINQHLVDKTKEFHKARNKKHFGTAHVLTVQEAREKQLERERKEQEQMTEKERKAALRGVITLSKIVWKDYKMDVDVFQ